MSTVSATLYYSAPLVPGGPTTDWAIDAVSRPPDWVMNFRHVGVDRAITDLRSSPAEPTLNEMGFQKIACHSTVDQRELLNGSPGTLAAYRSEVAKLLRDLTDADTLCFFDATLRREDTDLPPGPGHRSPHLRVHIDQTPTSARARVLAHGEPGRRFRRFQILNVWRPLLRPVRNYSLALCDYRSVDLAGDLVPTRLIFPPWLKDRETYSVLHNPRHRWWYWGSLAPEEAVVFKCYDSASRDLAAVSGSADVDGATDVAGLCPHSAFVDPTGPARGFLRTSVELRALIFHD